MEAEPDNQTAVRTEPRPSALDRYFAVMLPTDQVAEAPVVPAPEGVIRINSADSIATPPIVVVQSGWRQRLRQFDERVTEKLHHLDDQVMNSRPVIALLGLDKTNAAKVETSTEQTERQARLGGWAGVLAASGIVAAGSQRISNTAKLRATGAYLWLSNPEKRLTRGDTIIGAGIIAVAAVSFGYLAAKGFGVHHGLDANQAHHPIAHPEVTPTPHPSHVPSPNSSHTPMPSHQPHPPTPGHHGGHGNHGGHSPKSSPESGGPVRVHRGDGYTNLINHYAHVHHLQTSGAENYRIYLQLHELYGRHILEGISSYHLPHGGGLGISHPGLAHWHHGAEHEINKLLKPSKKKRGIFN